MSVQLITHSACLRHCPPAGHVERPARLEAVLAALSHARFAALERCEAPAAELADLARVHPIDMIERLQAFVPEQGRGVVALDADTWLSVGSWEAALRAAGAGLAGVAAVLEGRAQRAFCAVRPPGHHAEPDLSMGFCLFNNVAIAAMAALDVHGLDRVAILDFDVHHGNGTQAFAEGEPRVFFASSHQGQLYPGTGAAHERGAHGNIVNTPLPPGGHGEEFRQAWADTILPALKEFAPQLVLISAGFDGHRRDPLAQMALEAADFAWVTQAILDAVEDCAQGRCVSLLEGGYDLQALAESTAAHVGVLLGEPATLNGVEPARLALQD